MGWGPGTARRHMDLARICLGIGDELGNRLGRNRRVHHHDGGISDDARDGRNVADEIVVELVVQCRVDRVEKRISGGEVSFQSLPLWSLYSITSSARASSVGGTSRPSALAVLRLITSSYLVGACTGRSPGFSPLRIRST